MGNSEIYRPKEVSPRQTPSDALNELFTDVMVGYSDKVKRLGGVKNLPNFPEWELIQEKASAPIKKRYTQFSDIFDYSHVEWLHNAKFYTLPVGEYGREWGKEVICSASRITHALSDEKSGINMITETEALSVKYEYFLRNFTFYKEPKMIIDDSMSSLVTTVGLLTLYKVDGYEDHPDRLLNKLVHDRVFSKFSLVVPPGVIGTLPADTAVFTKPSVVRTGKSTLGIRRDIIDHFRKERSGFYKDNFNSDISLPLDRPGCPVGRTRMGKRVSGVDIMAKMLAEGVKSNYSKHE